MHLNISVLHCIWLFHPSALSSSIKLTIASQGFQLHINLSYNGNILLEGSVVLNLLIIIWIFDGLLTYKLKHSLTLFSVLLPQPNRTTILPKKSTISSHRGLRLKEWKAIWLQKVRSENCYFDKFCVISFYETLRVETFVYWFIAELASQISKK